MKKLFTLIAFALLCLGANAQVNLAEVINSANETEGYYPVFLDQHKEYVLDQVVDLGTKKVVIWGSNAKVTVKAAGQIQTQGYFQLREVNFLCSEATKAPIALSETPDESLKINDETSAIKFEGANQKVYWIDHKIEIYGCNFSDLGQSVIFANKKAYAVKELLLANNVIQLKGDNIDPVINWVGSSTGAIQNLVLVNNTIYNITANNEKSWMVRFGNASNAQPQKVWGTNGKSSFTMYNNTICFPGKALANNFPNKNNVTLDWKKNIFINTPYLQKTAGSAVRTFTNADNIIYFNNGKTADNTDQQKYGTVEDIEITVPTEALDVNKIFSLRNAFAPKFGTVASTQTFGDPRWAVPFKNGVVKAFGCNYEVVLGPDMITTKTKDGANKPAIDNVTYPWISYVNPTSVLDDGTVEVQQSNRWTDLNPVTDVKGEWLQVTGKNGSVNSPVISKTWGKYIVFYVKNVTGIKVYATGSASTKQADGEHLIVTAYGTSGSKIETSTTPGTIYGKGTASDVAVLEGLSFDEGYMITVEAAVKDIQVTGVKLIGDETVFPAENLFHSAADGEKAPGTNYEVVLGPDMLSDYALVSDPATTKPGINTEKFPWISYTRGDGLNALENGQFEAQKSNRWTDLNPTTGVKGEWLQVTGENGSVNSPVISAQWNKWMEANVKDATLFRVYGTGSASGSAADNNCLVITATANDGTVVSTTSTPGTIYGKGTASDYVEVKLDAAKPYVIKIETANKDIQITGFNITGTDLSIAPADENPGMGDATGIENVETSTSKNGRIYNVLGQEVKSAKGLVIRDGKKFIIR